MSRSNGNMETMKIHNIFLRLVIGMFIALMGIVAAFGGRAVQAAQSTPLAPTFGAIIGGTPVAPASPSTVTTVPTTTPVVPTSVPSTAAPTALPPTSGAVLGASPTVAVTPTALPTLRRDMMGIQVHPNLTEDQFRYMMDGAQFMGFRWMKIQLSWKELEPAPGQYSLLDSQIVLYMRLAQGRGFRMMVSVAKAPDWARPPAARGQADGPPAQPQQLADFISAAIRRYNLQPTDAIEIWNEPNTAHDWTGVPMNAATYLKYFDAAYKAVRSLSKMPVITAGLSPTSDGAGSVDDRRWLQELYAGGLLRSYPDVQIGIHPYGWSNPPDARCCANPGKGWDDNPQFFFLDTIDAYRAIMVKNGHNDGKLWATEFGWPTFDGLRVKDHVNGPPAKAPSDPGLGWMNRINETQQSAYTIRAFQIAQNGDYAGFMGPMVLWNMNFAALPGFVKDTEDSRPEAGFSVLNGDSFPRMLYNVLQATPKQ